MVSASDQSGRRTYRHERGITDGELALLARLHRSEKGAIGSSLAGVDVSGLL